MKKTLLIAFLILVLLLVVYGIWYISSSEEDVSLQSSVSDTQYCELFDLDKDDLNTTDDLKTFLKVMLGEACPVSNCDYNGDGEVNVQDQILLSDFVNDVPGSRCKN